MLTLAEIHIRDPFIVPVQEQNAYYLYGTTDAAVWRGKAEGFDAYRSRDLLAWEGPLPVFRPPSGFWATENYWAPEVHRYGGRYVLLASFKSPDRRRGTQILAADDPLGPFTPIGSGPATPAAWECLDGTLHVAPDGVPWIVFCHEWVQVGDGEICAAPLSGDLTRAIGEPILLLRASQMPWAVSMRSPGDYVTDGPFLWRAANGDLLMLWSSFVAGRRYAQGVSRSASGTVHGPWQHDPQPLFADDGGHGMLFRTFAGDLVLALHSPNASPAERARLLPVEDRDGRLTLR